MMNMYKESEILVSSRGRFRIKVCPSHTYGPTLNDDPPCFKVAEHSFNTCTKIAKKRGDDICSITVALIFVSYLLFSFKNEKLPFSHLKSWILPYAIRIVYM